VNSARSDVGPMRSTDDVPRPDGAQSLFLVAPVVRILMGNVEIELAVELLRGRVKQRA